MAQPLPQFLRQVGHHGTDQARHRLQALAQDPAVPRAVQVFQQIGQFPHPGDRLVEMELIQVRRHVGNGFMDGPVCCLGGRRQVPGHWRSDGNKADLRFRDHAPQPVHVTPGAVDPRVRPIQVPVRRAVRQHEQTRRIGAVGVDDGLGVDHVVARLAHFLRPADGHRRPGRGVHEGAVRGANHVFRIQPLAAVGVPIGLVADHALGEEPGEGLLDAQVSALFQGAGEEA